MLFKTIMMMMVMVYHDTYTTTCISGEENIKAGYNYYAEPKVKYDIPSCWKDIIETGYNEQYNNIMTPAAKTDTTTTTTTTSPTAIPITLSIDSAATTTSSSSNIAMDGKSIDSTASV